MTSCNNENSRYISGSISHVDPKYMPLVAAILEQAEKDLKFAIEHKNYSRAAALKKWFLSPYAQAMSGGNGQLIIDRIEKEFNEKKEGKENEH